MTIAEWLQNARQSLCAANAQTQACSTAKAAAKLTQALRGQPQTHARIAAQGNQHLQKPQVANYTRTVRRLLAHVLATPETQLLARDHIHLPENALACANTLLTRLLAGEPFAYLVGEQEFYGRPFCVSPATLIPRPETELLVEEALRLLPEGPLTFIDAGTGSGCIAISLCAERPLWHGFALDIAPDALAIAAQNAKNTGVAERLTCIEADFTQPNLAEMLATAMPNAQDAPSAIDLPAVLPASLGLFIANPPYISAEEWETCTAYDVKAYEPAHALLPVRGALANAQQPTGMEHLQALVLLAETLLAPGGYLLMEHGFKQGAACRALCQPRMWQSIRTGRDLTGHERFLCARKQ